MTLAGSWRPLCLFLPLALAVGCGAPEEHLREGPGDSSLSLLYRGPNLLAPTSSPTLYDVTFVSKGREALSQNGELPDPGELLILTELPVASEVTLTMYLYENDYSETNRTHVCRSSGPFDLHSGRTTSVDIACRVLHQDDEGMQVQLLWKVTTIEGDIRYVDDEEIIHSKDWDTKLLFHGKTERGEVITLKSWGNRLKFYIGGRYQFISAIHANLDKQTSSLTSIVMFPDGGSLVQAAPAQVHFHVDKVSLYRLGGQAPLAAIRFTLKDRYGEFVVQGTLYEKPWAKEFTVASYNVENLFDQEDDRRNAHYIDYRILPSRKGYVSNWGEPVAFEGQMLSHSEVKVKGIRRVLEAIEPSGPAFVALQEVESEKALKLLMNEVSDLGYTHSEFTTWTDGGKTAVGLAAISKFPIASVKNVDVPRPVGPPGAKKSPFRRGLRPVLRVTIEPEQGRTLTIYGNHWSSKRGPESLRVAYGIAVARDIAELLAEDPDADYIVTGDLNCEYNEEEILEDQHNDTEGKTGLNTYLRSQGDEQLVSQGSKRYRYNLHYELPITQRRTAWYSRYGWNSFDQMVIGSQMYDNKGFRYVDNSFAIPSPLAHSFGFLFNKRVRPKRWKKSRPRGEKKTIHEPGGYSDHLPVSMRVIDTGI